MIITLGKSIIFLLLIPSMVFSIQMARNCIKAGMPREVLKNLYILIITFISLVYIILI